MIAMPPKLSTVQQDTARVLLRKGMLYIYIANAVGCNLSKVKEMSRNMRIFGDIYAPKSIVDSRPLLITEEAVEVCSTQMIFGEL
jgi:hypothetical protein